MKHKHKWQFTNFKEDSRGYEIIGIRFVCECGKIKFVKSK